MPDHKVFFDIRVSTFKRNIVRITISLLMSIALIFFGSSMMPEEASINFGIEDLQYWSGFSFFGFIIFSVGVFSLIKLFIFVVRSIRSSGEWHFRLQNSLLQWDVPVHAHGAETGFRANLSDIKEIEFRTTEQYESFDSREYWVHFVRRESIQLKDYSGITLSWLVEQVCAQGVPYNETQF